MPVMQRLVLKMTTVNSCGVSKRFDKGVVMNDPHVGTLYADKKLLEERLRVLGKEHRELKHEHEWLLKAKYRAERDMKGAFETLEVLPSVDTYAKEQDLFAAQKSELAEVWTRENSLRQAVATARGATLKAL